MEGGRLTAPRNQITVPRRRITVPRRQITVLLRQVTVAAVDKRVKKEADCWEDSEGAERERVKKVVEEGDF